MPRMNGIGWPGGCWVVPSSVLVLTRNDRSPTTSPPWSRPARGVVPPSQSTLPDLLAAVRAVHRRRPACSSPRPWRRCSCADSFGRGGLFRGEMPRSRARASRRGPEADRRGRRRPGHRPVALPEPQDDQDLAHDVMDELGLHKVTTSSIHDPRGSGRSRLTCRTGGASAPAASPASACLQASRSARDIVVEMLAQSSSAFHMAEQTSRIDRPLRAWPLRGAGRTVVVTPTAPGVKDGRSPA